MSKYKLPSQLRIGKSYLTSQDGEWTGIVKLIKKEKGSHYPVVYTFEIMSHGMAKHGLDKGQTITIGSPTVDFILTNDCKTLVWNI